MKPRSGGRGVMRRGRRPQSTPPQQQRRRRSPDLTEAGGGRTTIFAIHRRQRDRGALYHAIRPDPVSLSLEQSEICLMAFAGFVLAIASVNQVHVPPAPPAELDEGITLR